MKLKVDPTLAENTRRKRVQLVMKSRWFNTLLAFGFLFVLVLHVPLRGWGWETWLLLVYLLVYVSLAVAGWRLWWRQAHPHGVRLGMRPWGKTGPSAVPDAPPPADPEHVWPPAPRRPG